MKRQDFEQLLTSGKTLVTPVIHVQDRDQALRNLDTVIKARCPGAFVINHDFPVEQMMPILRDIRAAQPEIWLGVNFLAEPGSVAFPLLGDLSREGCEIDAYWADDARIDERSTRQSAAEEMARIRADSGWQGHYFGGVAFKKQREVPAERYADAARAARPFLDVVTTSGIATGHAADLDKIRTFRQALGTAPLALASGVTPQNAARYIGLVDCFLVATGINHPGDFYNIDPDRLAALLAITSQEGDPA